MVERVVYVLGAGASFDAGGPLTRDFFARNRKYDERIYERYFLGNKKYEAIAAIYDDWKLQHKDPDIEKFFSEVATRDVYGDFYVPTSGETVSPGKVRDWLVWYMSTYIHTSCSAQRNPPTYYHDFIELLKKRGHPGSIITFNYDLVFDKLILDRYDAIDYGLPKANVYVKPRSLDIWSGIRMLKLHGSLNWTRCDMCDRIDVSVESRAHLERRKGCTSGCAGYRDPVIVPPVRDKERFLGSANPLWRKAYEELEEADKAVLIGYSVPEADAAARALLTQALARENSDCDLVIVNSNPDAVRRIERRLGRQSSLQNATPFKDFVSAQMSHG
jgi:NAD-dependent SIR2 family protein deacetylase